MTMQLIFTQKVKKKYCKIHPVSYFKKSSLLVKMLIYINVWCHKLILKHDQFLPPCLFKAPNIFHLKTLFHLFILDWNV